MRFKMHRKMALIPTFLVLAFHHVVTGLIICEDTTVPTKELAYNGAFDVNFPDSRKPRQTCQWLITAYRDGHVLRLRFDDVTMTRTTNGSSCYNQVVVYDGPNAGSPVLTSLCETGDVDVETSTRQALVVVTVDSSSALASNASFHLKYNSLMPRDNEHQAMWILTFVGIVGAMSCVVFCCGVLKCLFQWREARMAANSRARAATARNGGGDGDSGSGGGGEDGEAKNRTIADRLWHLLQRLFQEKHWRNPDSTNTSRNGPADRRPNRHQHQHQQRRQRQQQQQQAQQQRRRQPHQPRSDAVVVPSIDLDSHDSVVAQTSRDGFTFEDIPVTSFTSDPSEVKPPSYEDCLKHTNPLYLYHHGGEEGLAFYSRAMDIKEEQELSGNPTNEGLSPAPPPPYMEVDADESPTLPVGPDGSWSIAPSFSGDSGELPAQHDHYEVPAYSRFDDCGGSVADRAITESPPPFDELPDNPVSPPAPTHIHQHRTPKTQGVLMPKTNRNDTVKQEERQPRHTLNSAEPNNPSSQLHKPPDSTISNLSHGQRSFDNPSNKNILNVQSDESLGLTSEKGNTCTSQTRDTTLTAPIVQIPTRVSNARTPNNNDNNSNSNIPYALMHRSGLVTSLSDQQDVNQCVSPIEECATRVGATSLAHVGATSLRTEGENAEKGDDDSRNKGGKDDRLD